MNKDLLFCNDCVGKRWFEIEGNVKVCQSCKTKSSHRETKRKRWVYAKSHPDVTGTSPYNQPCDQNVRERFEEIQERFHLLSAREREVIELLWEGKTQDEVAAILDIGQQRVSACLNRARKKLVVTHQNDGSKTA